MGCIKTPSVKENKTITDTKLRVIMDGKEVDLEDAFYVFENIFEDMDDVFNEMEKVFGRVDRDIHNKLNKLKMKVAVKNPDRFNYISDHAQEQMRFQDEIREFEVSSAMRHQAAKRNLLFILAITIFISFTAAIFALLTDTKETKKTKTTVEQIQPKTSGDTSL